MLLRCYRDGSTGRVLGPDATKTWFATGDAGCLNADGTLSVTGRIAEMITTGGEKVWPDEIERVISAHKNVAEVAVWRRPDPDWGERVVAWVVPADVRPKAEELKELVAGTIAPWAAPKEIVFTTELPRTPSGKVKRSELR
jgi:acyl-CoA synthetase (AMP-forming)/AMP-acid ligase II